jgi:Flp pilus assembly protein TadG
MELITPGKQEKPHTSKAVDFTAWALFYLPDRASLKKALFGPVRTSPPAQPCFQGKSTVRRGAEGQALVEFALTLPFLIMLFVVLVELGLLIRSHMTVTSAVREGVRAVSSRGNADPSGGNPVNARVGSDGDLLLTQNINTALQQERQNVLLLMTYRADVTESPITSTRVTDPVSGRSTSTSLGYYGIGGQYGVLYNPALSLYPFQEIFDYTTTTTNGVTEKWFLPTVMSVSKCASVYLSSEPAKPVASTPAGNAYSGAAFCGDASNISSTAGITRTLPLGTNDPNAGNATAIVGKPRYGGGSNCARIGGTGSNKDDVLYSSAIQCWRYNYAPWYPALRYSLDFTGNNVNLTAGSPGYYNTQTENPANFGVAGIYRSPDYAGVQIVYNHKWLLTFFPGSLTLSDKAVKIMEPVGGGFSKPGS